MPQTRKILISSFYYTRIHHSSVLNLTFMTYEICRSSDDGTCRIWDARNSHNPRIYVPRPPDAINGQIIASISVNRSVLELVVV